MNDWPYRRCAFCRQLYDPRVDVELIHHMRGPHKPMPGIPDDGLETIPMDFRAGLHSRSGADPEPEPWAPPKPALVYNSQRSLRPKRRKRPKK